MPACQPGYRRLQVCIRNDLYRALVLIEAGEGVRRYRIIEDALTAYLGSGRRVGRYRVILVSEDVYSELTRLGGGDAEGGLRLLLASNQRLDPVIAGRVTELFGSVENALRLLLTAYEVVNKQTPQLGEARQKMQDQANAQPQVQAQSGEGEAELGFLDNPWVGIIRSRARTN
jgi:hypothetical protein